MTDNDCRLGHDDVGRWLRGPDAEPHHIHCPSGEACIIRFSHLSDIRQLRCCPVCGRPLTRAERKALVYDAATELQFPTGLQGVTGAARQTGKSTHLANATTWWLHRQLTSQARWRRAARLAAERIRRVRRHNQRIRHNGKRGTRR